MSQAIRHQVASDATRRILRHLADDPAADRAVRFDAILFAVLDAIYESEARRSGSVLLTYCQACKRAMEEMASEESAPPAGWLRSSASNEA